MSDYEAWVARGRPWHRFSPMPRTPTGRERGCGVCGIYAEYHEAIVGSAIGGQESGSS